MIIHIYILIGHFVLTNCECPARKKRYPDYVDHPCKRKCVQNVTMVCEYDFNIQHYFTVQGDCKNCTNGNESDCYLPDCIPADGRKKMIQVYNGMMPGPKIEVCQNDEIVVHLSNKLGTQSTTLHFHGMLQQKSPWMDGVPMVTQCPILPMNTFTYRFIAEQQGTHFYHSHSASQLGDGAYGALIVRQPDTINPFKQFNAISSGSNFYDEDLSEHIMVIREWTENSCEYHLMDFARNKIGYSKIVKSLLINSIGSSNKSIPMERFHIKKGKFYRFRIINAAAPSCLLKFSIEDHQLIVISSDGSDIRPITVDTLSISNGERFDIVVQADRKPKLYKIQILGYAYCKNLNTTAILQYKHSDENRTDEIRAMGDINPPKAIELNDVINYNSEAIYYDKMYNLHKTEKYWDGKICDKKYYVVDIINSNFDNSYKGVMDGNTYNLFINNISYIPASKPYLFNDNVKSCNNTHLPKWCNGSICQCSHIDNVRYGCLVELILLDLSTGILHPIHLHGYKFWVVGQGKLKNKTSIDEVKELDEKGLLNRGNMERPILKDTVTIPQGGYTIVRFISNNPGYWLLHCHSGFHIEEGMALILKTGKVLQHVPKDFPRCGDWPTKVDEDEKCHIV